MPHAHVFQDRQVDKARRPDAVAIRIRPAVADEIKAELAFGRFDAAVSFAGLGPKPANLRLWVDDRAGRNVAQGLFQNLQGLAHFQEPNHVPIESVSLLAQWHTERKAVVNAVLVNLANVVIHSAGPQHRPADARVDGELLRQHADALRAGDEDFIFGQQPLELVEKSRVAIDHLPGLLQPTGRQITTAAAKAHVIAHHPRAGERLEQVENLLALTEGIHERRARGAHVLQKEADQDSVIDQAGQFGCDDADVFGAFGCLQPGKLLHRERVCPVVGQRTEIIEPIGVGHRAEIARLLGDFFMVAMQVAEDRLELHDAFAIQHHVHAKHAVRRRVLRAHRHFEQFAFKFAGGGSFRYHRVVRLTRAFSRGEKRGIGRRDCCGSISQCEQRLASSGMERNDASEGVCATSPRAASLMALPPAGDAASPSPALDHVAWVRIRSRPARRSPCA